MKTLILNGGNYGAVEVSIPADKTKIAVQSGETEYWVYDSTVHPQTSTADFVGMFSAGAAVLSEPTTHIVDFRGA